VKAGIKLSKYLFVLVFTGSRVGMGFLPLLGEAFVQDYGKAEKGLQFGCWFSHCHQNGDTDHVVHFPGF
jgi:hypothetical protein